MTKSSCFCLTFYFLGKKRGCRAVSVAHYCILAAKGNYLGGCGRREKKWFSSLSSPIGGVFLVKIENFYQKNTPS
jgi:hypothetical protein